MTDFIFKAFDEMTDEDYAAIGFKGGLEVHQQLLTQKKLFCRCPAGKYSPDYDAEILRHMRPTLSELGEYDGTALMEFKTRKDIIYKIKHETVCTYEMDDTPPFELNEEALDIALEAGLLYGSNIVDEIHIARKQYLDGSIPTGFQRTAIVSVGGRLEYKDRQIGITQLAIEEDACRELSDIGHTREYLTDRLGMPLIETVTDPDMKTPQELAEVCDILRYLVRSTGKVRTGHGAGRQDVNVSVRGGTRIEIKGVPRIPEIPRLTYNEAMRQWSLLQIREELLLRGINEKSFEAVIKDVTKFVSNSLYEPIKNAVARGMSVKAILLPGYRGILRRQTQTDTYFSQEISDRVRVIACLTTLPNIIHSDSPSETITAREWQRIKRFLRSGKDDAIVLVWGDSKDAETGASEVAMRAREATVGVPSETRQAHQDGTNGFERILPGPNRMYPDTDLPPKRIPRERLKSISKNLKPNFRKLELRYRELDIPDDVVRPLSLSQFTHLFESILSDKQIPPKLAAVAIVQFRKRLIKAGENYERITPSVMRMIFDLFISGKIVKDGIFSIMVQACRSGDSGIDNYLEPCLEGELESVIKSAYNEIGNINIHNPARENMVLMGIIMKKLRGRINGADVIKKLKYQGGGRNDG